MMRLVTVLILWTLLGSLCAQSSPSPLLGEIRKSILTDDVDEVVYLLDLKEKDILFVKSAIEIMGSEDCIQKLSILENATQRAQVVASYRVQLILHIAAARSYFHYDLYRQGDSALKKAMQLTVKDTTSTWMKGQIYYAMGKSQRLQKNYEKARAHYHDAIVQELGSPNPSSEFLSNVYFDMGSNSLELAALDSAYQYLALSYKNLSSKKESKDLLESLANVYLEIGDYEMTFRLFTELLDLMDSSTETSRIAEIHATLASCSWAIGDAARAVSHLNASNALIHEKMEVESIQLRNNMLLAEIYFSEEESKKALELLTQSISLTLYSSDDKAIFDLYLRMGQYFRKRKEFEASIDALYQASLISEKINSPGAQAVAFTELADTFTDMGLLGEAISNLDAAMDYLKKDNSSIGPSDVLNRKARIFMLIDDLNQSEKILNQSFSASTSQSMKSRAYVEGLLLKAELMRRRSIFTSATQLLEEAWVIHEATKLTHYLPADVNYWYTTSRKIHSSLLQIEFALYNQKKIGIYLHQAFDHFKRIKELELEREKVSFPRNPSKNQLLSRYARLQAAVVSGPVRKTWRVLQKTYADRIVSNVEADAKAPANTVGLEELTEFLGDQTLMISYHLTAKDIYRLQIAQGEAKMDKIPIRSDLASHVDGLRKGIERGLDWLYLRKARILYELLIPDNIPFSVRQIIVCPDGPLYQLPFETLLTERVLDVDDPMSWPYLLHQKDIQYALSMTDLGQSDRPDDLSSWTFLGVANDMDTSGSSISLLSRIDSLFDEYNIETTLISGSVAQSSLSQDELYSIGYLVDDLSKKVTDNSTILEDDLNIQYDKGSIYHVPLEGQAKMIVYPSTITETGRIFDDEGARKFIHQIVPEESQNLLFSLWSSEKLPATLMSIVSDIINGKNPARACREAKIELLYSPLTAHPRHWATYVLYGTVQPIGGDN